jgi:hypothetical protein
MVDRLSYRQAVGYPLVACDRLRLIITSMETIAADRFAQGVHVGDVVPG